MCVGVGATCVMQVLPESVEAVSFGSGLAGESGATSGRKNNVSYDVFGQSIKRYNHDRAP